MRAAGLEVRQDTLETGHRVLSLRAFGSEELLEIAIVWNFIGMIRLLTIGNGEEKDTGNDDSKTTG